MLELRFVVTSDDPWVTILALVCTDDTWVCMCYYEGLDIRRSDAQPVIHWNQSALLVLHGWSVCESCVCMWQWWHVHSAIIWMCVSVFHEFCLCLNFLPSDHIQHFYMASTIKGHRLRGHMYNNLFWDDLCVKVSHLTSAFQLHFSYELTQVFSDCFACSYRDCLHVAAFRSAQSVSQCVQHTQVFTHIWFFWNSFVFQCLLCLSSLASGSMSLECTAAHVHTVTSCLLHVTL